MDLFLYKISIYFLKRKIKLKLKIEESEIQMNISYRASMGMSQLCPPLAPRCIICSLCFLFKSILSILLGFTSAPRLLPMSQSPFIQVINLSADPLFFFLFLNNRNFILRKSLGQSQRDVKMCIFRQVVCSNIT